MKYSPKKCFVRFSRIEPLRRFCPHVMPSCEKLTRKSAIVDCVTVEMKRQRSPVVRHLNIWLVR